MDILTDGIWKFLQAMPYLTAYGMVGGVVLALLFSKGGGIGKRKKAKIRS